MSRQKIPTPQQSIRGVVENMKQYFRRLPTEYLEAVDQALQEELVRRELKAQNM